MSKEVSISEGTKAIVQNAGSDQSIGKFDKSTLHGRVVNICLSVTDPLYDTTNTLESIQFEPVTDVTTDRKSGDKTKTYLIAFKSDPSIRTPLINEIVSLVPAPNINVQNINSQFAKAFYYGNPISIYGAVEHNAAPDDNTLDGLLAKSQQNTLSSYNQSLSGVNNNTNGTDTIVSNDTLRLGNYFLEQGVKQLTPLEGDHKIEGRFGNSIRFGGSPSTDVSKNTLWSGPVGTPITIIRNGARKIVPGVNTASIFEDINEDGSSVYFLQSQSIELVLGSDNFDTYSQNNDNSTVKSQIIIVASKTQPSGSSFADDDTIVPVETSTLPVSSSAIQGSTTVPNDISNIPDSEDDLNFVQIGEDIEVPLTQGVVLNNFNSSYNFTQGTNISSVLNTSLPKAPKVSLASVNAINGFSGTVSSVPLITRNGKALVDLVALTEGTMGTGKFNGYDIIVGGSFLPGFSSWTASPPHPNVKIFISDYGVYSSASGRYQFTINTWNLVMGAGTVMSKFNQDYACWKNILNSANVPTLLIGQIDSNQNSFNMVINMMATQWASLPLLNDPKGLYKQAGRFSFDTLYQYFNQILSKY